MFSQDKDRLYVALYARGGPSKMPGGEDKYHWAIIAGPKTESASTRGKRYHAKESMRAASAVWEYNEQETGTAQTHMLLVRVQIGKIKDMKSLESTLRSIPIRGNQPGWNCVGWVKEALETLQKNKKALGTSILDWNTVRNATMAYIQRKAAEHRFDGKAPGKFNMDEAATYDLLTKKELIR